MDKQNCNDCVFFNKEANAKNLAQPTMECRANPPSVVSFVTPNELGNALNLNIQSQFPRVTPEMWCGNFFDGVEEPENEVEIVEVKAE